MFQTLEVSRDLRPAVPAQVRTEKPSPACPLLAEDARPWAKQLADYVRIVPQSAVGDAVADLAGCLIWLNDRGPADSSSPNADSPAVGPVESVAIRQWLHHLRFQSLLSRSGTALAAATPRSRLTVYLNPMHVWSRVEPRPGRDAADDRPAATPQTILLVAVGEETRTVALPPYVADWLRRLERCGPQRLRTALAGLATHPGDDALDLLQQLAAAGAIAVA